MTLEDELKKVETIINEAEDLVAKDTLDTAGYKQIMAGLGQADAILHRIMNDYATEKVGLSVSQVYLASDLLERLHQVKHHLSPHSQ